MKSRTLLFTVLAAAGLLAAAQDTCPATCDIGPVNGDRIISDCTAQCNTHFGDPVGAEECVRVCNDWQEAFECDVVVMNSRRSASSLERRRRPVGSSTPLVEHSGVADSDSPDDTLHQLEARATLAACLAGCRSGATKANICPGNLLAAGAQVLAMACESGCYAIFGNKPPPRPFPHYQNTGSK